ncbi:MAG: hypothetical protein KJN93_02930 [Alphaproteobacteria bacterium]|nr:hypothetical protein [Alphaproteobacteria bacterium]
MRKINMTKKSQAHEPSIFDRPSEAMVTIDAALETSAHTNAEPANAGLRDRSQHRRYHWMFEDLMN